MNKDIFERLLLNQLAILEGLVVALPLGNRRGIQDSIVQTEITLRKLEILQYPTQQGVTRAGGASIPPNGASSMPRTGGGGAEAVRDGVQQPQD
jgi:hypothetical protein